MEFLIEYGLFLAKAITIVVAIALVIGIIASAGQKNKSSSEGHISITDLSDELKQLEDGIRKEIISKDDYKHYLKKQKADEKAQAKKEKQEAKSKAKEEKSKLKEGKDNSETEDDSNDANTNNKEKRLFVMNFKGDVEASAVENLREEITAVLSVATENDEVLVRLESPGGMVHTYGLAASQLKRIGSRNIKLTIAVDEVAASGGYMMACVADRIIAAPFAIIGSVGVLGQFPNFHRLLKHNKVDYEQHTAGEFKRTLTMFGENTDKDREKFREELEETHVLFKQFISENRPSLDVDSIATGEHWYGSQALEKNLIDELSTSDDVIVNWAKERSVFEVKYEIKKSFSERLPIAIQKGMYSFLANSWQRSQAFRLFK